MTFIKKKGKRLLVCLGIAAAALLLGQWIHIIGGSVFAILIGILLALHIKKEEALQAGITFTSRKTPQYAVTLLGLGLNLSVIVKTGQQSPPIIIATITTSLVIASALKRGLHIPASISTLVGVGSSVCEGPAIAATTPVIVADNEGVAQAISAIFSFNIPTATLFSLLGTLLQSQGSEGFGVFADTTMNDTSSITATTVTWDSMFHLGSATLGKAAIVRLTRTLAIILVVPFLGIQRMRKEKQEEKREEKRLAREQTLPAFILYFLMAPIITTVSTNILHMSPNIFLPLRELSEFFTIIAMEAAGLHTDTVELVKNGDRSISMRFCCRVGITLIFLLTQRLLGTW